MHEKTLGLEMNESASGFRGDVATRIICSLKCWNEIHDPENGSCIEIKLGNIPQIKLSIAVHGLRARDGIRYLSATTPIHIPFAK